MFRTTHGQKSGDDIPAMFAEIQLCEIHIPEEYIRLGRKIMDCITITWGMFHGRINIQKICGLSIGFVLR